MRRLTRSIALLALLALITACGAQGQEEAQPDMAGGQPATAAGGGSAERAAGEAPEATDGGGGTDGTAGGPPAEGALAAPIEQRIIKTGEITLEVESVAESLGRIRATVAELNGYVGGSQAGTLSDSATLTVRIPAESFDEVLARLHELDAEVIAESTREEDVTTQVVDLQARIENLQASEASYRELVARAERVEDILAVQLRLDEVRGQIEQLTAQLEALEGQASLSTLTITLIPRAEPVTEQTETWSPGEQLDQALASLVGMGQGLLNALIWLAVVWVPVLLLLALLAFVLIRVGLEIRRRIPPAPAVLNRPIDEA